MVYDPLEKQEVRTERKLIMALIHKFIQGDQRLVIDVNSGAIHSIDDVCMTY